VSKKFIVKTSDFIASQHLRCATFWNDVSEALIRGKSLDEIREMKRAAEAAEQQEGARHG
jgi:hypothetical protein